VDAPRAPQRQRVGGGGAGDGDSQISGNDNDDERALQVEPEEDLDDLYLDRFEMPRNPNDAPFLWEQVAVPRAVVRDLRSGEREEPAAKTLSTSHRTSL
jgi:hypothetical protein